MRIFEGGTASLHDCCFSRGGKTVVSADADNMIRLWNVESGTLSRTLEGHNAVHCVDVPPDGKHILSGSDDVMRLWKFTTDVDFASSEMLECIVIRDPCKRESEQERADGTRRYYCCSYSPSGALFLVGDCESLQLYDLAAYQPVWCRTAVDYGCCNVVAFSFVPGGASVLSCSYERSFKLWCTTTGQLLRTFHGHADEVMSCAFSPTGHTIVSGFGMQPRASSNKP